MSHTNLFLCVQYCADTPLQAEHVRTRSRTASTNRKHTRLRHML